MNLNKRLNWMIGIIIGCFFICFFLILFYKPYKSDDNPELNQALEEQRQATKEQIKAREEMIEQAVKMVGYLKERDSTINASLTNNTNELNKIRNEKKSFDYTDYSSDELQRAVANAARFYRNSQ